MRRARELHSLRSAYRSLFFVEGRFAERVDAVEREFADDPLVGKMIAFIRAGGNRPLMRPRTRRWNDGADDALLRASRRDCAAAGRGPLAIICGGGSFPGAVAEAIERRGRRPVMFAHQGWADPKVVERYTHHWIAIGQVGRFFRLARAEHCREVLVHRHAVAAAAHGRSGLIGRPSG